ncbi:7458_t:CDS:1, partial [Entrophospora sp. SA101]
LDACTAITDRCISEITQSCPNLKYINLASLYRDSNISSASVIEIA